MIEGEYLGLIMMYGSGFILGMMFLLIPTWIAVSRKSRNRMWIFLFNFLLGGLIVTWVAALVWSMCDKKEM